MKKISKRIIIISLIITSFVLSCMIFFMIRIGYWQHRVNDLSQKLSSAYAMKKGYEQQLDDKEFVDAQRIPEFINELLDLIESSSVQLVSVHPGSVNAVAQQPYQIFTIDLSLQGKYQAWAELIDLIVTMKKGFPVIESATMSSKNNAVDVIDGTLRLRIYVQGDTHD